MTERIRKFLKKRREDGPCLVVDLDVIRENYASFAKTLPDTRVFYAVKANPAPEILKLLADLGSSFDTASPAEIEMVLAAGATADRPRLRTCRDELLAHALEHAPRRVGVGDEEVAVDALALRLVPGFLEEAHESGIVHGEDRVRAVRRGLDERESAIGQERVPDRVGAGGHLVRRHRDPEVRLDLRVVAAMALRVDDLHRRVIRIRGS